jgi:C4-dicarboxylate-specific signal transduction histidine kinase
VEIQRWMILLFFTAFVMIIISGYSLSRHLTKPIQEMIQGIKRIHSNRQKVYFEQHWNDEFGLLQNEFIQLMTALNEAHDSMEDQVQERTWQLTQTNDALRDSNEKLNKAIFELKEAQEKLIESEKLSALGRISVRISHELNTPLGICITSASYLQGQLRQLKNKKLELGSEEKDLDFEAILEFEESLELIMVQLKKSKGIIDYLKEMPVEYQVKSIKNVSVRNEIEGALKIFETAGSELEKVVHMNCPLEVTTRSYEGALQEVFEKLIDNSLKHGCMLDKTCEITIDVKPFKGGIEIEYRDNGAGIDADLLNYIFEPLYKKSMGMKGAGMGLTRVYQLVKNLLGGELSISNGEGGGVVIHMVLTGHI